MISKSTDRRPTGGGGNESRLWVRSSIDFVIRLVFSGRLYFKSVLVFSLLILSTAFRQRLLDQRFHVFKRWRGGYSAGMLAMWRRQTTDTLSLISFMFHSVLHVFKSELGFITSFWLSWANMIYQYLQLGFFLSSGIVVYPLKWRSGNLTGVSDVLRIWHDFARISFLRKPNIL
jgi:hypothetical protein